MGLGDSVLVVCKRDIIILQGRAASVKHLKMLKKMQEIYNDVSIDNNSSKESKSKVD